MIYQRSYFSDLANSGKAFSRLPQPLPGPPRELHAHAAAPALPPWMLGKRGRLVPAAWGPLPPEPNPLPSPWVPHPLPPCGRDPCRALSRRVHAWPCGWHGGSGATAARPALRSGGARNAAEPPVPCAALPCPAVPPQRGPGCPCAHGRAQLG